MVENVSPAGSVEAPVTRHSLENREKVSINDAHLIFQGDYSREGHDLLVSHDGKTILVENYFLNDDGPSLAGPNGAFLSYQTVSALAGPIAPGQYAQAGTGSGLVEIGKIVKLTGSAASEHPDGTKSELAVGDPVYQGDVVSTGPDSSLGISFIDESVFSLSAEARMVLDELVFDPNEAENSSMTFNLVEGAFVFVTGQIAPTGNMKIETPVATMGIRGTTPKVLINTLLGVVEFSILPDPDSGKIGVYQIVNKETGAIMGTVESSGDKWVVTTLTDDQAVRIAKNGLDLLNDKIALDEIRDVFSRALGDRTQLDGANSFGQVGFDASASNGEGTTDDANNQDGGGPGGSNNSEDGDVDPDDPPIAGDDAFTLDEDSFVIANVIDGSVGGIDVDPDGYALNVTQVDGDALTFAPNGFATITLPSGAVLNIRANGNFNYDPGDAFDYLAVGEQAIDTFTYTITDAGGFTDTATVTVTVLGRNDQPEVQIVDVDGSITDISETANDPPQSNAGPLNDSGSFTFTDVDLTDRPTASITGVSITGIAQNGITPLALTAAQIQAITEAFTISAGAGNTNNGTIFWDYTIQESSLDFLGTDEVVTALFTITINDGSGVGAGGGNNEPATTTQVVTIIINGSTDDEPVISVQSGDSASEPLTETNAGLTTDGTLTVNDVDLNDTATVAVLSVDATGTTNGLISGNGDLLAMLTLTAGPIAADTGDVNNIDWSFDSGSEAFDYLAVGEQLTLTYSIQATDSQGDTGNIHTVTIVVTGTNDAPVIQPATGAGVDSGAITELTDADGDENALTHSQTGTIQFDDVDTTDTHTLTATPDAGNPTDVPSATLQITQPTTTNATTNGSFGWTFTVEDSDLEFLAVGETRTFNYTLTVNDGNGGTDQRVVTIVVTGTNDAPIIQPATGAGVDTGAITELTDADGDENAFTHSQNGTVQFDDVDVLDTHSLTSTPDAGNPTDLPSATFTITQPTTTNATTNGSFGWTFTVEDSDLEFLAVGETRTFNYTLTVADGNGGTDQRVVTIVVTGTNDAPVIQPATGAGVDTGAITELTDADGDENAFTHSQNGTVQFDDVDVLDTHSLTSTPDAGNPTDLPSATFTITQPTTTNGTTNGSFGWTFTVEDSDLEFLAVGETRTFNYTLTVNDGNGGTDQRVVTIVVTGTNDAPLISTTDPTTTLAESELAITAGGNFDATDADFTDVVNVASVTVTTSGDDVGAPANGNLIGMLTVTPPVSGTVISNNATAGSGSWAFNSGLDQFDYLAVGEQLTLTYEITLADGNGGQDVHTVTIHVTGTNDAPVLTIDGTGGVTEDDPAFGTIILRDAGSLSFTDVDASDSHSVTWALNGAPVWSGGSLTSQQATNLTTGFSADLDSWDYAVVNADLQFLGAGETVTFSFDVTVTDNSGAGNNSDTETVTITVTGVNDAPVVSATTNPAAVNEGDTGVLSLESFTLADYFTATDADQNDTPVIDESSVVISVNPASDTNDFSSLAINGSGDTTRIDVDTANFDFLAEGEQAVFDVTFNVVSGTDTVQRTITITIDGENDAPVADPESVTTDEEVPVTIDVLDGDTDVDNNAVLELDSFTQGTNGTVTRDDNGTPTDFTDDQLVYTPNTNFSGTDTFTYTVEDEHGASDTETVTVTVNPVNDPPQVTNIASASDMLAAYTFDDTSDESGNARELTLNGSATLGTGLFGGGLELDGVLGSNATAEVPSADFGSGDFTVQIWANFDTFAAEQTLIEKFTGGAGPGWTLTFFGGSLHFYAPTVANGTIAFNGSTAGATTGVWNQFVITRSGDTFDLYWNGTHIGQTTNAGELTSSTNPLLIGARNAGDGRNFTVDGTIDNVVVLERAWSSTEVSNAWNGGNGVEPADYMAIVEIAAGQPGEDTALHSRQGTIDFSEVNLSDTHTVTVTPTGAGYLGTLVANVTDPSTGDGSGQVSWTFEVNDAELAPLAPGEQVTQVYNVTIDDGEGGTDIQTLEFTLTGVNNDPPEIVAGGTLAWEIGDGAKAIDGTITVTDVDSPMLIGGRVTISQNYDQGADLLGFVNQNGINGTFNPTTGVLTLTGTASVADYETALQSVTFTTSGLPPSDLDREISFVVNDGEDDSQIATSTVTVESFNAVSGATSGPDTLTGTGDADIIFGLDGGDTINGGDGRDILIGGPGADILDGGAGPDIFVFNDALSVDTVLNFDSGEDSIDLEALLTAGFDPNNPGAEITFAESTLSAGNTSIWANGVEVADLGTLTNGETINIIYDQTEAEISVQVSGLV